MNKIYTLINKLNNEIFLIIFNNFNKSKLVSKIFIIISKISHYLFFTIYFLGLVYIIFLQKNLTFPYLSTIFFTIITNRILRKTFKVKRPSQSLKINSTLYHKPNYGFPSNHSACAVAVVFCLMAIDIKFKSLMILAILTGFSRVVVGVHYPLDILAGYLVGTFFGAIFF